MDHTVVITAEGNFLRSSLSSMTRGICGFISVFKIFFKKLILFRVRDLELFCDRLRNRLLFLRSVNNNAIALVLLNWLVGWFYLIVYRILHLNGILFLRLCRTYDRYWYKNRDVHEGFPLSKYPHCLGVRLDYNFPPASTFEGSGSDSNPCSEFYRGKG